MVFCVILFLHLISVNGQATSVVAIATKSRVYDNNQKLTPKQVSYVFDFTDAIKQQLIDDYPNSYDEDFFNNNPMHGISREALFHSILPTNQRLKTFCSPHGKILVSSDNKAEGRMQYTFEVGEQKNLFGANFTYLRGDLGNGAIGPLLNDAGKATPTWEVYDNFSNTLTGINAQGVSNHQVYLPTQGTGFFVASDEVISIEQVAIERNYLEFDASQVNVIVERRDGATQSHRPVAQSSLCYGFTDLPQ